MIRLLARLVVRTLYRVSILGIENIPTSGGVVIVANHVSYLDAIMISSMVTRPVRYVMDNEIFQSAPWLFRALGAIPIASRDRDPAVYTAAMATISQSLRQGFAVCIFPEGRITRTGDMNELRPGVLKILATDPVPVVPISIAGMWGSYFSFRWGVGPNKLPRHFRARISLICHPALPATAALGEMDEAIKSGLST